MGLSPKQELFCLEYMKDLNASAAAVRAGYSAKTSKEKGYELMQNPEIKKRVQVEKRKIAKKIGVDAEWITREYMRIAQSNIQDFVGQENQVLDVTTLSRAKASSIKMVKKTVTTFDGGTKETVQIDLHPKLVALEALARHTGYFEADNNQKGIEITVTRTK